jgi:hypothetical protein
VNQKNIIFSIHAKQQMQLRGVQEEEVISTIHGSNWKSAKRGKFSCKKRFDFGNNSPVNQQFYQYKTVEVVFADNLTEIIVVTTKVYYHNP